MECPNCEQLMGMTEQGDGWECLQCGEFVGWDYELPDEAQVEAADEAQQQEE